MHAVFDFYRLDILSGTSDSNKIRDRLIAVDRLSEPQISKIYCNEEINCFSLDDCGQTVAFELMQFWFKVSFQCLCLAH